METVTQPRSRSAAELSTLRAFCGNPTKIFQKPGFFDVFRGNTPLTPVENPVENVENIRVFPKGTKVILGDYVD